MKRSCKTNIRRAAIITYLAGVVDHPRGGSLNNMVSFVTLPEMSSIACGSTEEGRTE